jgi:sterol 3beta-glucosyltransferase
MIAKLRKQLDLPPSQSAFGSWKDGLGWHRRVGRKEFAPGITTIYPFPEELVPRDPQWGDNVYTTGFVFLRSKHMIDETKMERLIRFLDKSHDPRPIVYVGFGSIVVKSATELTRRLVEAAMTANVRMVILKGWIDSAKACPRRNSLSARNGLEEHSKTFIDQVDADEYLVVMRQYCASITHYFPSCSADMHRTFYIVKEISHDWLFDRVDAVVHHGGLGTTAAGLRAGKPTLIIPFFGDQYFWGRRIKEYGIGNWIPNNGGKFNMKQLVESFQLITQDEAVRQKAVELSKIVRRQDGLSNAVEIILREYEKFGSWKDRVRLRR